MKQQRAIPGSWARTTIGATAEIIRGVSFPKDARKLVPHPGHVACLRTANVQREVEWDDLWFVPEEYVKVESRYVQPLDVLISVSNSLELVGKVAQVTNLPQKSTLGAFISLLRPSSALDAKFYYYQMASPEVKSEIRYSASTTTNISNISSGKLSAVTLEVPPLPEQHRIVAEIEKQFTRLDASVAALKRARANLKRYRASVLKAAGEGRLVPTEADLARVGDRDYEPAFSLLERILAERRTHWESQEKRRGKYKETSAPETSVLSDLPEGWVWATVEQIIIGTPQNGLYKPKSEYGDGVPILRIDDFQDFYLRDRDSLQRLKITPEEIGTYGLQQDQLVVNRVNSPSHLGKCLVVPDGLLPAVYESNMMRMTTSSLIDSLFVAYCLRSPIGRSHLTSNAKWAVNQASINQTDVCSTPIPLPPLVEQRRIVAEVERRLSVIQQTEAAVEASLKRAGRLRQSILKQAFSGQLVPQDPNDEPASVLLEHIRAEREAAQAASKGSHSPRRRRAKQSPEKQLVLRGGNP